MKLFAVTGKPILHSKSPLMFNAAFQQNGIQAKYVRLAADTAEEAISQFRSLGIKGMNVTAPFKQDIMPLLDKIDAAAQTIGSVNTVVEHDGKLIGYNTDHLGVANSLLSHGIQLQDKNVVVLGAGGAARGVLYALSQYGAKATVVNRTYAKAVQLANEFNCQAKEITTLKETLVAADIFISTLGGDTCIVDSDWIRPDLVIFDANYKSSTLLKLAAKKNCKTISGLDWLLHQATPAYALFLNEQADMACMRKALEAGSINKKNYNLALVGFMGVGKTTNGSLFAEKYDMRFVDSDIAITKRHKKSVTAIFEEEGETAFRQKETETLHHISRYPNAVISCGGGLVITPENREVLKKRTLTVWLTASPEMVIERMKPNSRPLLAVDDPLTKAKELLAKRIGLYADVADLVCSTEGRSTEQIVEKIYEEISLAFNG